MVIRRKIKRGQKVEVSFRPRERELVLDHTFTGPELTTQLRRAQLVDGTHVVRYTLDDLDELLGFVAAEANHSTDRKNAQGTRRALCSAPSRDGVVR